MSLTDIFYQDFARFATKVGWKTQTMHLRKASKTKRKVAPSAYLKLMTHWDDALYAYAVNRFQRGYTKETKIPPSPYLQLQLPPVEVRINPLLLVDLQFEVVPEQEGCGGTCTQYR